MTKSTLWLPFFAVFGLALAQPAHAQSNFQARTSYTGFRTQERRLRSSATDTRKMRVSRKELSFSSAPDNNPGPLRILFARQDSALQVAASTARSDSPVQIESVSPGVFRWGLPASGPMIPGAVGMQPHPVLFVPAYDESYGLTLTVQGNRSSRGPTGVRPFFRGVTRPVFAIQKWFRY
jgi:hypothetical protein